MVTVHRIVIKRIDGAYMTVRFEPARSIQAAARFHDIEEYNNFMHGHYRPEHPELYMPQPIKVTYEEDEHEREHEHLRKGS